MQSYKELNIYKMAHTLAVEIHKMSLEELPKFEIFEVGLQIRRSSKGVAATIVEGFGRKLYQQEYIKYLTYAIASCDETREHLEVLFETGSLKNQAMYSNLKGRYEELGKMVYRFREAIQEGLRLAA